MSVIDTLITNRTSEAKYDYTDLNRVESAVSYVRAALEADGYFLDLTVKTDWAAADEPAMADFERYRSNVAAIRAVLPVLTSTPQTPATKKILTAAGANAIEQILSDCDTLISAMEAVFLRANEMLLESGSAYYLPEIDGRPLLGSDGAEILCANGQPLRVRR